MRTRASIAWAAVSTLALGCDSERTAPDAAAPDVAVDVRADTAVDAPAEAAIDAPPDIAIDTPADVARDALPDLTTDAARDAAGDGVNDAASDVANDASSDVPTDASPPMTRVTVPMFHYDIQHSGANRNERALTPEALRTGRFSRDTGFVTTLDGDVYGQPLYVPDVMTPTGLHDVLVVATQANSLYGLDAVTGAMLWRGAFEPAVPLARLPCGNIGPTTGIVSTPVYDPSTGLVWAVAYNSLNAGVTRRFSLRSFEIATGRERADLGTVLSLPTSNGSAWDPSAQGQRGAITLVDGRVYVSFGGLYNDCAVYHGWVVGVNITRTSDQISFGTSGVGSGFWAYGGPVADGVGHLFATNGNGRSPDSMGSTLFRFATRPAGPVYTPTTNDFFSPSNRNYMDVSDSDFGSIAPIVLPDHVGSRTPHLIFQGSKHGTAFLVNRDNLGGLGVSRPPPRSNEAVYADDLYGVGLYGAAATWTDGREVYVFAPGRGIRLRGCASGTGGATAVRLRLDTAGNSSFEALWCTASIGNPSAPTVSSNGNDTPVLWITGTEPPEMRAYDVNTGVELYATSGASAPPSVRQWVPPVVVDGRVYVTGNNAVFLYRLR